HLGDAGAGRPFDVEAAVMVVSMPSAGSFFPLPLWERVARIARCETGEGSRTLVMPLPLTRLAVASRRRSTLSHKGRGEGCRQGPRPPLWPTGGWGFRGWGARGLPVFVPGRGGAGG